MARYHSKPYHDNSNEDFIVDGFILNAHDDDDLCASQDRKRRSTSKNHVFHKVLPGGLRAGDTVYSLISYASKSQKGKIVPVGMDGVVQGETFREGDKPGYYSGDKVPQLYDATVGATKPCDAEPACRFRQEYIDNEKKALPKREPGTGGYCARCECTGEVHVGPYDRRRPNKVYLQWDSDKTYSFVNVRNVRVIVKNQKASSSPCHVLHVKYQAPACEVEGCKAGMLVKAIRRAEKDGHTLHKKQAEHELVRIRRKPTRQQEKCKCQGTGEGDPYAMRALLTTISLTKPGEPIDLSSALEVQKAKLIEFKKAKRTMRAQGRALSKKLAMMGSRDKFRAKERINEKELQTELEQTNDDYKKAIAELGFGLQ